MTDPSTMRTITRHEREALAKLIRQRERLAKTAAAERSAVLLADFEQQADRMYSYDEDAIWRQAVLTSEDPDADALAAIREAMARGAAETPPAPGRKSHAARVAAQGATHPQGEAA